MYFQVYVKEYFFNDYSNERVKMKSDKIYPDSGVGAISFLKDVSAINLNGAIASSDFKTKGVWLVEHRKNVGSDMSIVYLRGYTDKPGSIREQNKFESV